ncbi:nuclear body protein [Clarias magur]|uniref:Nuclear body protein n=1 Tax=Clarias magur TaxID=1594786 RepID=A0A8J4UXX8_CLAMG|nr:nuclear body protein [Clarias magur]
MDRLDFLTEDQMKEFLRFNKTRISCMEEPHTFLNQLRDYNLVPEELYRKVIKMKGKERKQKGVYDILDWVENKQGQCMKDFWRCVFQDHILQKYDVLHLLQKSLLDDFLRIHESVPNVEKTSSRKQAEREVKKQAQKKSATKRRKSAKETDEEEPGCSSVSRKKKPAMKPTNPPLSKRGTLPVTCGNMKGTLYPDKLAKGEECIQCQDCWFTPNDFEKFSGRESSKNWKLSIFWQNIPLQRLLKEGHLRCPHYSRFCGQKRGIFSSSREECSSPLSRVETDESSDDLQDIDKVDKVTDRGDLSTFEASALPVSCGSVSGFLYKSRFAGSRSKSIRTEERWFTPEEFVRQELMLTDGNWKKDILCHGKTLTYLVKNEILNVHALSCPCLLCCPKDHRDQDNDDVCYICNTEENLVCCDGCPRAFHHHCHLPTLHEDTLGDEWTCTFCVLKSNQRLWIHMNREGALSILVPGNILRCEYLLLRLYNGDTECVFTDDPTETVPRYNGVISNPMWLDRVRAKLQKNEYRTVGQFVHDIDLIFNNCRTFNKVIQIKQR